MPRWNRREFTIGCTSLMAGLLVGCERERPTLQAVSEPAAPPGLAGAEATIDDLHTILERRASAVQEDDEQTFLADLDQSNQKLLERQQTVFANLRQLEFDKFRYLTPGIIPPLPDENGVSRFAPVIGIAKLVIDAAPGGVAPAEAFAYDVTMRDGTPVVGDIVPITRRNAEKVAVSTQVYANAPWNTTPLEIVKAGNVWLAGDDTVDDLQTYADAAQAQVAEVEALWGDRARFPGYILFFTRRKPNLRAWYDFGKQSDLFEGVQVPLQGVRRNGEVYRGRYAGSRIVVNLQSIELNGDDPVHVMRHELAHAVTARATAVDIGLGDFSVIAPRWAIEGFARWVENLESPDRQSQQRGVVADGVASGLFDDTTPQSDGFYDESSIQFNYAVSASVFDYAQQTASRDAAIDLYAQTVELSDLPGEPLVGLPAFDGVCERVLGVSSAAFMQDWASFVRSGA